MNFAFLLSERKNFTKLSLNIKLNYYIRTKKASNLFKAAINKLFKVLLLLLIYIWQISSDYNYLVSKEICFI